MVSHQPAKFGGLNHCGCGDMTLLVVEEWISTFSLKSAITLSLIYMACHALKHKISELRNGYLSFYVNKSDTGQKHLEQQEKKYTKTTFASLSKFAVEKKKK